METFQRSLLERAHWHLEDDVILAPDFLPRAALLVSEYGQSLISGFSSGWGHGSRPASSFLATLCVWLPEGYGPQIATYLRTWPRLAQHPTGFDLVIRDWLVSRRMRYWLECPSIVQHARCKSLLGPRSKFRQSKSYGERYGDLG